jgi:hypothetical protein
VPSVGARAPKSRRLGGRSQQRMSSRTVTTNTTSAPPRAGSGLNLGTLVIAAISAVVAATVVSRLWQPGTVMATAMTPVLVTLVREALERPARRVSAITVRPPQARGEAAPPPAVVVTDDDGMTPMRIYRPQRRVRRRWKLAIASGLLAFLIAVAAMTLPELVAGRSVVSGSHETTIFGGKRHLAPTTSKTKDDTTTSKHDTVSTEQTTRQDTTSTEQQTTTTAPVQPVAPAPQTQTQPQTQPPTTTTQPPAAAPQEQPTTP